MPPRRHVAFRGVARLDVDDRVEEVGFAMLAAEVLVVGNRRAVSESPVVQGGGGRRDNGRGRTYPRNDVMGVSQVCLTVLAAVDDVRVEVGVVC